MKHTIIIILLIFLLTDILQGQVNNFDSLTFHCYTQRFKNAQYISIIESSLKNGNKYYHLSFIQPRGHVPKSYTLCEVNDSLCIITKKINDVDEITDSGNIECYSYNKLNKKKFIKDFDDTVSLYKYTRLGFSYIWLIAYGHHSGILSYMYYDNNILHFCIKALENEKKDQTTIKKVLKLYGDKMMLNAFINREKYPKASIFDINGNEVIM